MPGTVSIPTPSPGPRLRELAMIETQQHVHDRVRRDLAARQYRRRELNDISTLVD
jgi:hypothetical protein